MAGTVALIWILFWRNRRKEPEQCVRFVRDGTGRLKEVGIDEAELIDQNPWTN